MKPFPRTVLPCALLMLAACAGGGGHTRLPTSPSGRAPRFMNLPVYSGPLDQAPDAVQRAWALWLDVKSASPPPSAASAAAFDPWLTDTLRPWLSDYNSKAKTVRAALEPLSGGTNSERMYAVIMELMISEDIIEKLRAPTIPAGVPQRMTSAHRAWLDGIVLDVRRSELPLWKQCVELVSQSSPSMRGWWEVCRREDAKLQRDVEQLTNPAVQPLRSSADPDPGPVLPPPSSIPATCAIPVPAVVELDAPPPNPRSRLDIAVQLTDATRLGNARERLVRAVQARVRTAVPGASFVSARELRAAETLVAARKLTARGAACGLAPSFARVLSARHRNLVVARVSPSCSSASNCSLTLSFERPGQPGDTSGLPASMTVTVPSDEPASWVASAARLTEVRSNVTPATGATSNEARAVRVYGADRADPLLHVSSTLQSVSAPLVACRARANVAAFRVKWTITPQGGTQAVTVEAEGSDDSTQAEQAACLQGVLAKLAWPCTRDSVMANVDVRLCVQGNPTPVGRLDDAPPPSAPQPMDEAP